MASSCCWRPVRWACSCRHRDRDRGSLESVARLASDRSNEAAVPALTARQQQAADDYAKLPVSFVENQGQTDARVRYFAQGNGYSFFMTPSEVMLSFAKDSTEQQTPQELALALRFVGGNPKVEPQGSERAPGVINDLRGVDPSMWHTDIAQYRDVVYPDLWPKIDMRLREQSGVLKYEFHVHPGASPSDIQLAYGGADGLALSETGGLQIATPLGMLEDSVPLSYQDIGGVRVPVASRYVLDDNANANGRFSFDVGGYQRDHELIIDPGVQYTTFLGGNSAETAVSIAVDSAGNAYVAGTTQSPNFPTTTGAFDRTGAASELRRRLRDQAQPGRHRTRVFDLRRWQRHGVRTRHGARWIRQRLRHRPDQVVELPDHRRCVRPEPQHPGELPTVRDRQHRQLRLQAQRGRLGTDVLDLPRWHRLRRRPAASPSTDPAMRTWRARRCRRLSDHGGRVRPDARRRVRHVRDQAQHHRLGARLLDVPRWRGRSTTAGG